LKKVQEHQGNINCSLNIGLNKFICPRDMFNMRLLHKNRDKKIVA